MKRVALSLLVLAGSGIAAAEGAGVVLSSAENAALLSPPGPDAAKADDKSSKLTGSKDFMAHLREARSAERDDELKHHVSEHKHAVEVESRPKVVAMAPRHAVSHDKEANEALADKDLRAMIQDQNKKDDTSRVTAHYDELPADGMRPMVKEVALPVPRNADGSEDVGAWYHDRQHRLTGALFEQRAQMQGILDQLHAIHESADAKTKSKLETLAGSVQAMEPNFEGLIEILLNKIKEEAAEDEETEEEVYAGKETPDGRPVMQGGGGGGGGGGGNPSAAAFYAAQLAQSGMAAASNQAQALMRLQEQLQNLKSNQVQQSEWLHQLYAAILNGPHGDYYSGNHDGSGGGDETAMQQGMIQQQQQQQPHGPVPVMMTNDAGRRVMYLPTSGPNGGPVMIPAPQSDTPGPPMPTGGFPDENTEGRDDDSASGVEADEAGASAAAAAQAGVSPDDATAIPMASLGHPGDYLVSVKDPRPAAWWRDGGSPGGAPPSFPGAGSSSSNPHADRIPAGSAGGIKGAGRFQTFAHGPSSMGDFQKDLKASSQEEHRNGALMHMVTALEKHRAAATNLAQMRHAHGLQKIKALQSHPAVESVVEEKPKVELEHIAEDESHEEQHTKHQSNLKKHRSRVEELEAKVSEEEDELKKVEAELKARASQK